MDDIRVNTATIAAGASLSGAVQMLPNDGRLMAIVTASTWDAAKLSFQGSWDGVNYFVIKYEGTEYECASVTGAAWVSVNPQVFLGVRYLKVQSGISTAATAQADATILTFVMMEL